MDAKEEIRLDDLYLDDDDLTDWLSCGYDPKEKLNDLDNNFMDNDDDEEDDVASSKTILARYKETVVAELRTRALDRFENNTMATFDFKIDTIHFNNNAMAPVINTMNVGQL